MDGMARIRAPNVRARDAVPSDQPQSANDPVRRFETARIAWSAARRRADRRANDGRGAEATAETGGEDPRAYPPACSSFTPSRSRSCLMSAFATDFM